MLQFVAGESDVPHGGEEFPAEGLDGPADEAAGAAGEQVPGEEDGYQLFLGDMERGEGEAAVRVAESSLRGIIFKGGSQPVPNEVDAALGCLG